MCFEPKCSVRQRLWFTGLVAANLIGRCAQVAVVPTDEPQRLFGSGDRLVNVLISNRSDKAVSLHAKVRLVQLTSATAVNVSESPWRELKIWPQQTVVESAQVYLPEVKAETRFLIQWVEGTNIVFGTTEILVYPTNLLAELKMLAGAAPLGVFDPAGQLKPLLKAVAVEFQDLLEDGTDKFTGKLAIFGPFDARKTMRAGLADDIRALAKRGAAVVWLLPPPGRRVPLKPSCYAVPVGAGAVVVAQVEMVSRLAENPAAQVNLLQLAEAALRPEPLDLPETRNAD